MYSVEKKINQYEQFILKDTDYNTVAVVTPSRGGMLTGFSKNGEEYIYINDENFYSEERPRCAMPVLFPSCGKLTDNLFTINNKSYPMDIHGVAHISKWDKIAESTDGCASVTISLKANSETKKSYPFDFELIYTYSLKGGVLTVYQEYINHGEEVMPFTFGFHPYFNVSHVDNLKYDINAKTAINNSTGEEEAFNGDISLVSNESFKLIDAKEYASIYDTALKRDVKVTFDENFTYVVLWSNNFEKFLCVEPWTALPNSLNTGNTHRLLPKETLKAKISIEI